VTVIVENAAIGATGSDLAAFRARRDILDRECDLVFVEYAVNDHDAPPVRRRRSREGLLRQLLGNGKADVVLVSTFRREFHADMLAGRVPASVADLEELAAHYGLNTVWPGLAAAIHVHAGILRWEQWLPDGLHPSPLGSALYAEAVVDLIRATLTLPHTPSLPLPPPTDPRCWEAVETLDFETLTLGGPWSIRRWGNLKWIDRALVSLAPGGTIKGTFEGHTLAVGNDFGAVSSEFRWRLDGGPWQETARERPAWAGDSGWLRTDILAEDLGSGSHTFEIECIFGDRPECRGATTAIAFLGVVR
jgi:lysophospholipase L1-like esterase